MPGSCSRSRTPLRTRQAAPVESQWPAPTQHQCYATLHGNLPYPPQTAPLSHQSQPRHQCQPTSQSHYINAPPPPPPTILGEIRSLIERLSDTELMDLICNGDGASTRLQRAAYACPPGYPPDLAQEHADFNKSKQKCNSEMKARSRNPTEIKPKSSRKPA